MKKKEKLGQYNDQSKLQYLRLALDKNQPDYIFRDILYKGDGCMPPDEQAQSFMTFKMAEAKLKYKIQRMKTMIKLQLP